MWMHKSEQIMLNVRKREPELNEQIDYKLTAFIPVLPHFDFLSQQRWDKAAGGLHHDDRNRRLKPDYL